MYIYDNKLIGKDYKYFVCTKLIENGFGNYIFQGVLITHDGESFNVDIPENIYNKIPNGMKSHPREEPYYKFRIEKNGDIN